MEVRSVEAIAHALQEAQVRYLIVGGLAVNAHGFERLTRDVDLVIQLVPDNIIRGLRALMAIGYHLGIPVTPEEFADRNKREGWRQEKGMIVLKLWSDLHQRTPVDVFVYEPFDFEVEYVLSEDKEIMPRVLAKVVTYPTLIRMKQEAGRPHDLTDIIDLERLQQLKTEGHLDDQGRIR
jgi:hypothetical protein